MKNAIRPRLLPVLAATVVLALTSAQGLFGQAAGGNLVGTVFDQTGATIPGALVEATSTATNTKSSTMSAADGSYRFGNLPVGIYDIKTSHTGFSSTTVRTVNIALNATSTANLTLMLGSVEQSVEVTDSAVLIDTTTAQVTSTFGSREAIDTPTSGLAMGVLNLSLLGAGVANAGGLGLGDGPSVGGQRPRNNNFNIEGVDNNRADVTGVNFHVPNESVQEFSMIQNQASAEFGNGTGGQFNTVIKGGGNKIHGAVFEYLQNRNLNAMDQTDKRNGLTSNPRQDDNTFGGAIGGPIMKDKLFYYGLYQYEPSGSTSTPSSSIFAPTAAGYSTLSAIPGVSQTNLGILKQYLPAAASGSDTTTVSGVSIPIGVIPVTQPSFTNITTYLLSFDYNVGVNDRMHGRFGNEKHNGFDTSTLPPLPSFFEGRVNASKFLSFSEFHNFSPSLVNEFRFGYNRFNDTIPAGNYKYPNLDVFPNITIENDLAVQLGPYQDAPQSTILNTYQLSDNVNWTVGRHTWKFGWDARKYINLSHFIQRERGDYGYATLERFILDQNPNVLAERNVGGLPYSGNHIRNSLYFNDDFRWNSHLTVNVGLRWEYKGVPRDDSQQALNAISNVPALGIVFAKPTAQMTAFGPRIGLAYSPGTSGRTSIRAGFGISYDKYFDNLSTLSRPPQISSTVDIPLAATTTNFLANGGIKPTAQGEAACSDAPSCRAATSSIMFNQDLPYAITWNVGIQHVFHGDYTLEARYLGTRGVHLYTQNRLNVTSVVDPTHFLPTYFQTPSSAQLAGLNTTLGSLLAIDPITPAYQPYFDDAFLVAFPNWGNSTYHGLALELTRRFSRNLLFKGAYTWSHNIDDSTADLFSTLLSPRRPQDFRNLAGDRSSSFLDRRHRFTYNVVYDVPWFTKSSNRLARYTLGGYILSGTYTYESPQFATVQSGIDSNLNGDSAGDRAIVNPNGVPNTGSAVNAIDKGGNIVAAGSDDVVAYVAKDPTAQYVVAGLGALATSGRQTLATRPINNWDIQIKKTFAIGEFRKFEIGAQFINAFNHPQYVPGYVNIVQFHQSTDTRNNLIPGNSVFNRPDQVYDSNARFIQLTARFQF